MSALVTLGNLRSALTVMRSRGPSFESVQIAHDKAALMSLAQERGIPFPKTVVALLEAMGSGVPAVVTRVGG